MSVEPPTIETLLSRGFFPENLPPIFTSSRLWPHYQPKESAYLINRKSTGSLSIYNASKRGHQRRLFALPHPAFVHDQAAFLNRHWPDILDRLSKSYGSLSKPTISMDGPRSVRITPHSELPKARLKAFSRFKFCVTTDVSRCFPSIYTHSIPWALNGKSAAKNDSKHTSALVYGNRLDFIVRQAQDRQTTGIPVGPDTSRVISEIVLSAVDEQFLKRSGRRRPVYIRHVDDYWIAGNSAEECEGHLRNLRAALREFELDINDLKTRIVSTNHVFGDSWPSEFESELKESLQPRIRWITSNRKDPIFTLGKIIDRATKENDDGMIRHAIRKIDENRLWQNNWEILEHFLAQCAVQFPHSFDYVARVIAWRARLGGQYDRRMWREVTNLVASQAATLGRDSEVLWSLWLMKELGIKIPKKISDLAIRNNNPLVLSFVAHLHIHALTSDADIPAKLRNSIQSDAYSGASWPLALELSHLEIEDSLFVGSSSDPVLRTLHDSRISIIDWDALPRVFVSDAPPDRDDEEPEFAIEDFTSDYESEEEEEEEEDDDSVPL